MGLYLLAWLRISSWILFNSLSEIHRAIQSLFPFVPPSVRLSATVSVALDFSSNICCNLLTEYILCFVYFLFSAGCFSIYFHVLRSFVAYFILRLLVIATAAVIVAAVAAPAAPAVAIVVGTP